jgi:hypothetical protein
MKLTAWTKLLCIVVSGWFAVAAIGCGAGVDEGAVMQAEPEVIDGDPEAGEEDLYP